jgi:DNA-binding transcriptional ArsR family regulator
LTYILVKTKLYLLSSSLLQTIASPRRQEILRLVWAEERSAGDIHRAMPDVTFGAVSLQLRALLEAGLVESRREERNRFYRAKRQALAPFAAMLEQMWDDALWKLKVAAEWEQTRRGPKPGRNRSKGRKKE